MPSDAKFVEAEQIAALFAGQEAGKRIIPGPEGMPKLDEQEAPKPLNLAETQELRKNIYSIESDPIKIEAEHDALVSGIEPDYTAWLEKVAEIKARYPLPISIIA